MPKAISILSPFHNLPIADVVDQLGSLKAHIADLETREKALRDELLRRGASLAAGTAYDAAITQAVRWTINTKSVKAEMGEAWWTSRCQQSMVTTVAVKPRVVVQALAA